MAGGYGGEIYLDAVATSMLDLAPSVILCSETQERFMWVVPPEMADMIIDHYNRQFALPVISSGAGAKIIGKIRTDGQFVVIHNGTEIVNALGKDITRGIVSDRPVAELQYTGVEPTLASCDLNETLLKLLAHENIASRAPIFESYDKQVQGRTQIEAGCANAGVLAPFNEAKYPPEIRQTGIALSVDHNPNYNKISPYWGAVNAVVESARNVASVGALPQAMTDCLCFGNPEIPTQMWAFAESVRGINDACLAIGLQEHPGAALPIIAGNVSLYNETKDGPIPPSPMISCLGSMPDVSKAITSAFKQADSILLMIGERLDECGGSVYYQLENYLGLHVPKPNLQTIAREIQAVTTIIQQGYVLAAQDISEGGIAVALAEMSFENQIGCDVEIPGDLSASKLLFGESGGFVLEVTKAHLAAVEKLLTKNQIAFWQLGSTTTSAQICIKNGIDLAIMDAKRVWDNGLREKLT